MLVSDILKASLRKIGALSSGETIETARQAEALSALQIMLRSWGGVNSNIFASVQESFVLSAGSLSYSWGSGGDIDTLRPNQVLGAYILDSGGTSHPIDIISKDSYRAISVKDTSARPYDLYFSSLYPLAYIYLYPVPAEVETLYLDSYKPFTQSGSFGLVTDSISFPVTYEEAIIYNLAMRLAPEYGRSVSADVAMIAKESLADITVANLAGRIEPVYLLIPGDGINGSRYSINSNTFR